jgi:ubiquinone/menaquinone biosynthesis C-methylase UbiE
VDRTEDPEFFVRFMREGHKLPDIVAARQRATDLLELRPGDHIVDVGCGPALDAGDLSSIIGPDGELVGVDASETMIAAARRYASALEAKTRFEVASAYELPFGDATFDASRAERLFMHLSEPQQALNEMSRVTRPGGRICVVDFDWHTLLIDHPEAATTEKLLSDFADDFADGRIGRKLRRMFRDAGLQEAKLEMRPVQFTPAFSELLFAGYFARRQTDGRLQAHQISGWWEHLKAAQDNGTYFVAVVLFIAAATK